MRAASALADKGVASPGTDLVTHRVGSASVILSASEPFHEAAREALLARPASRRFRFETGQGVGRPRADSGHAAFTTADRLSRVTHIDDVSHGRLVWEPECIAAGEPIDMNEPRLLTQVGSLNRVSGLTVQDPMMMTTVLTEAGEFSVDAAEGLAMAPDEIERLTGWALKREGMCREALCVPLPDAITASGQVGLAAFWRHLGNPVLANAAADVWVLGAGAEERSTVLLGLAAPDIVLPDLAGVPHSLADLRGKKVFLTTWASW